MAASIYSDKHLMEVTATIPHPTQPPPPTHTHTETQDNRFYCHQICCLIQSICKKTVACTVAEGGAMLVYL